ncbi:MAG: hypothetical protein ACI8PZ_006853 [Myxococcota bacterium]|jgi:hypothetical protein
MRWFPLTLLGCGQMLEADITVRVRGEIRAQFDRQNAARVIMRIDQPQIGRTVALGLLCDSNDEDRDFLYNAIGMGCARSEGFIEAWIEPWSVDDAAVTCGPSDDFFNDGYDVPRPKDGPYASQTLWADGGGCDPLIESVELVLEAPPGWASTFSTTTVPGSSTSGSQ